MDKSKPRQPHPQSHLFTVRMWIETLRPNQREVRMQVKHVLSGETRYFRDGSLLLAYLLAKMQEFERASRADDEYS